MIHYTGIIYYYNPTIGFLFHNMANKCFGILKNLL